jgi:hypothetical protein
MFDRANDKKFVKWAKQVKNRDNFTCQICFRENVYLNSHHMNSWDMFTKERYDLDNGITLCSDCHDQFHNIYGRGKNTKYQFQEYRDTITLLKTIAKKVVLAKKIEPAKP